MTSFRLILIGAILFVFLLENSSAFYLLFMVAIATRNGSITDRLKKNKEENTCFQDVNNFITYILLQVLEVGVVRPPNVHYALNQMIAEPTKFVYKWDQLGPWTQCSRLCQGMTQIYTRFVYMIK